MTPGGEIMQIKLKIALAAAGFALATIPAFAVEMPTDGSKNFSTPADAPSYFSNEAVPEPARVATARPPLPARMWRRPGCRAGFRGRDWNRSGTANTPPPTSLPGTPPASPRGMAGRRATRNRHRRRPLRRCTARRKAPLPGAGQRARQRPGAKAGHPPARAKPAPQNTPRATRGSMWRRSRRERRLSHRLSRGFSRLLGGQ